MRRRLDRAWRLLGTGFSFVVFGLGGLAVSLLLVPVLRCFPGSADRRAQRVQFCFHHLFRGYVRMMRLLGLLSFRIEGVERLHGAGLVLANHPSLLDVVFLISLLPNACCVIKGRLTRNFFVRGAVRAAGYIVNESPAVVIEEARRILASGQSLIVFPEGTRTTPSKPLKFRRGAANIAVRTGFDITPVLIYCQPTTLTKNDLWYEIPPEPVRFRILVRDKLTVDQYAALESPAKAARLLTSALVDYFDKELKAHG